MSKPPLVVRPGKYRTRDGRVATITRYVPGDTWPWCGTVSGTHLTWRPNGIQVDKDDLGPADLMERIDEPKPRKRTAKARERMEWGVWIPADNSMYAENIIWHIKDKNALGADMMAKVSVRRLPLAQRRKGKGARK